MILTLTNISCLKSIQEIWFEMKFFEPIYRINQTKVFSSYSNIKLSNRCILNNHVCITFAYFT